MDDLRLKPDELYWRCDPAQFEFTTTRDLPGVENGEPPEDTAG